jgi:hypothetical protein
MKICPACRKGYSDDSLNFCLEDGSVLTLAPQSSQETVMMNQAPETEANYPQGIAGVRTSYGDQQGFSIQPAAAKGSRAWVWGLGILGVLVLTCGGGFAAFFVYIASLGHEDGKAERPVPDRPSSPSPTPFPRDQVQTVDLAAWVRKSSEFGNTAYSGDEFFMSSKKKGFYYVVAATDEYKTERASTSVVVRNVDDESSSLGYGLVFHSDPRPLQKGYAFIIDTKQERYRLARHEPGKEIDIVKWTDSTSIKPGSAENTLEVRDTPNGMQLYINGQQVTSVKNTHGYRGGVAGLYAGDAVNVGFKKLEIAK